MINLAKKLQFPNMRVGNVLSLHYLVRARPCFFKGLCISLKKQRLVNKTAFFILRNVITRIGMEFASPIFAFNMMNINVISNQAKEGFLRKSKLLYLRKKVNKRSIIKF